MCRLQVTQPANKQTINQRDTFVIIYFIHYRFLLVFSKLNTGYVISSCNETLRYYL